MYIDAFPVRREKLVIIK